MRPLYTDFDDFDEFEFDDSLAVKQMLREIEREKIRMASRRKHGPGKKKRWHDDADEDFGDYEDYEDYEDYDEYDDDEFDSFSGINIDN